MSELIQTENRLGTGFGPKVQLDYPLTIRRCNKDWKAPRIRTSAGRWLFSHGRAIVFKPHRPEEYFRKYGNAEPRASAPQVYLDAESWHRSFTTSWHRNEFLGEPIVKTRQKLATGEYVLVDLN